MALYRKQSIWCIICKIGSLTTLGAHYMVNQFYGSLKKTILSLHFTDQAGRRTLFSSSAFRSTARISPRPHATYTDRQTDTRSSSAPSSPCFLFPQSTCGRLFIQILNSIHANRGAGDVIIRLWKLDKQTSRVSWLLACSNKTVALLFYRRSIDLRD